MRLRTEKAKLGWWVLTKLSVKALREVNLGKTSADTILWYTDTTASYWRALRRLSMRVLQAGSEGGEVGSLSMVR